MADVEAVIRERLGELDAERSKLEAALAALRNTSGGSRRRPAPRTPRRTNRSTSKRAKPGERREQVLAYLKKSPGAGPTDIATAVGISANQTHALIRRLQADKLVAKRGGGYRLGSAAAAAKKPDGGQSSGRPQTSSRSKSQSERK